VRDPRDLRAGAQNGLGLLVHSQIERARFVLKDGRQEAIQHREALLVLAATHASPGGQLMAMIVVV